jgi:hypothetical protein
LHIWFSYSCFREFQKNGSLVNKLFRLLYSKSWKGALSFNIKCKLVSFWLLIPILHNSLKNASIGSHNGWLENYFHIMILVRWYFYLFRIDLKRKLLNSISNLLFNVKFNCTSDFVTILNFYFLNYSLRHLWWDQSAKIKYSLFCKEHIRLH